MNITHFVENLNRGGLERAVIDLAVQQQASGHRCQIVCLYEEGALAPELAATPIRVHACGKRRSLDPGAIARARRLLRLHDTEVLHTHNAMAHYYAVAAGLGLPIRCTVNSRHSMTGRKSSGRLEWLYRCSMPRTDAVAAVCRMAGEDAVRRGIVPAGKLRVVPNGIPMRDFVPANAGKHAWLCSQLHLPAETRLIGTVGRLAPIKDQATLIRAYAAAHASLPDAALVLVGDGSERAALAQCAVDEGVAGSVRFLGDRSDVRELLQGLDLFVLCSLSEGYSMALLEASASALPIVATDVGGNAEIVRDGVTGTLVPARDPATLAKAMLALLNDRDAAAALGRAARNWAEDEASLETMAQRYAALYRDPARQP